MHRPSPREIIMAYKLTWLADVLRAAGCTVVEEDGWKDRGRGQMGNVLGVMHHHTGPGSEKGPIELIRDCRPDLAGPLSQHTLGRASWQERVGQCLAVQEGGGPLKKTIEKVNR